MICCFTRLAQLVEKIDTILAASSGSLSSPATPPKLTPTDAGHELFKDPTNDILLCSADKITFPFRKLHLESASEVFEGMLDAGLEGPRKKRGSSAASSALEVVDLVEEAKVFEKYLMFIHPHEEGPVIETYEELELYVLCLDAAVGEHWLTEWKD